MQRSLDALAEDPLDVLVVGGGIHGAWTARAAAMRGLRVGLAEAVDLASGTSSRSTMLAHGGLRYLAQFDLGLVHEALQERGILTRKMPHLVQPLPFILPFYEDAPYPRWQLKVGIQLYSFLARGSGYPSHRFLSREKVLELEPGISPKGLKGGALYYDGQILAPERLVTEIARDAHRRGAKLANHAEVSEVLTTDGRAHGAVVRDAFTGEEHTVTASTVLNTTGPFLDRVLEAFGAEDGMLRLTKGVHLITPRFTDHAIVINARDGRTFFTLPWYRYQLIGTTDTDYTEDPRDVHATQEDVSYLRDSTRRWFPDAPVDQVHYTYAGLRNLLNVEGVDPSQVTRKPLLHHHGDEGMAGFYSLAGGKLTTARATASELLDAAREHLGRPAPRVLDTDPLPAGRLDLRQALEEARALVAKHGAPPETAERLVALYGAHWPSVAEGGLKPLCDHDSLVRGEAVLAAEQEMAWTVEDVLRRRTLAWARAPCQGEETVEAVVEVLEAAGRPPGLVQASATAWEESLALNRRWR